MSDFGVDVLKFLQAKQNALSSLTLYSSHRKLSYQIALKRRFLRPFGNDANLGCEGPQSTLPRSSEEEIPAPWNWISVFKAVSLTTCVVNKVRVSKDELLKSGVDCKRTYVVLFSYF